MSDEATNGNSAGPSVESSKQTVVGRPFQKGVSGNPSGRAKGIVALIRERTHGGIELVERMIEVMRGESKIRHDYVTKDGVMSHYNEVPSHKDRMQAIEWLGDRLWGKPAQTLEHTGLMSREITIIWPGGGTISNGDRPIGNGDNNGHPAIPAQVTEIGS